MPLSPLPGRRVGNTTEVGSVTEAMVLAALVRAGFDVLVPWNRGIRYDLLMEREGVYSRIQCKTGRLKSGGIEFSVASSYAHRGRGARRYTASECDFFGVYCPQTESVYLVPLLITGGRACKLRVDPPKNGQRKGIHHALQYRLA